MLDAHTWVPNSRVAFSKDKPLLGTVSTSHRMMHTCISRTLMQNYTLQPFLNIASLQLHFASNTQLFPSFPFTTLSYILGAKIHLSQHDTKLHLASHTQLFTSFSHYCTATLHIYMKCISDSIMLNCIPDKITPCNVETVFHMTSCTIMRHRTAHYRWLHAISSAAALISLARSSCQMGNSRS